MPFIPVPESRPWAPFRTLADFEYTETAVKGLLSEELVNKQLAGFNAGWCIGGSHLTLRTYKDMQEVLAKARQYGVQVSSKIWQVFTYPKYDISSEKIKYQQFIVGSTWSLNSSTAILGNIVSTLFRINLLHPLAAGTLYKRSIVVAQSRWKLESLMNRVQLMLGGKLM